MSIRLTFTLGVLDSLVIGSGPVLSITLTNVGNHDLVLRDIGLKFPSREVSLRDISGDPPWGTLVAAPAPEIVQAGETVSHTIFFETLKYILGKYQLPSPVHFAAWTDTAPGGGFLVTRFYSPIWVAEVGKTSFLDEQTSVVVRPG